jgi:hypothetical protein
MVRRCCGLGLLRKLSWLRLGLRFRRNCWRDPGRFLDEGGHCLARLRALAKPILGAIQFEGEIIIAPLQGQIGPYFLDALSVTGAAVVRDDNAEGGLVLGPDAF